MSGGFSILAGMMNICLGPILIRLFVGDGQEQVVEYGFFLRR